MPTGIGILSSQRGYHTLALEDALKERGYAPAFFPVHRLATWVEGRPFVHVRGASLDECQALLVRTVPAGSLEQIIFRMDVLHRLEASGVRVINSAAAIERTVDKYRTSFMLSDAGIPTPRTAVAEDFDAAMDACREMKDVIIKPLFGSEGKGMVRAADEETAYRVLRAWELNRYVFYIQECLPHFDRDVRAFVIGGRVAAAMMRRGTGWKTNFSQGAQVEPVTLTPEMERLALAATRLLELDYAGVDLMTVEDGRTLVIEVNSIPGWRGLEKTTDQRIAGLIADYVVSSLRDGVRA